MQTIAYELVGNCFVLVVGRNNPADLEWDKYLSFVQGHLKPGSSPVTLVSSSGGGPTPAQRERLNKMTKTVGVEKTLKVAVLTESAIVRGIATALSWFVSGYKAFPPDEIGDALDFLGVSGTTAAQVKLLVPNLQKQVR